MMHTTEMSSNEQRVQRPRVLIIESMLGHTGRHSRSQGEVLAELFADEGYDVRTASSIEPRAARLLRMARAIFQRRRETDLAIIAVFSGRSFWFAAVPAACASVVGLPYVAFLHGGNLPGFARRHPRRVRWLLRNAAAVVAPSNYLASALSALVGEPIRVIPNVVPTAFSPDVDRQTTATDVLWMRALDETYAPCVAVDVLAQLRRDGFDVRLTLAGPDKAGLAGALQARAAALGVEDHVRLPGFLNADAKREAFGSHAVFLNTSRVDNTPVSLIEAAAAGLPLVTTAAGGLPDLFEDERSALFAPVDDVDSLVRQVARVLTDDVLATRLSAGGVIRARSMCWFEVHSAWQLLFRELSIRGTGRLT